jgi:hypothetical protein
MQRVDQRPNLVAALRKAYAIVFSFKVQILTISQSTGIENAFFTRELIQS